MVLTALKVARGPAEPPLSPLSDTDITAAETLFLSGDCSGRCLFESSNVIIVLNGPAKAEDIGLWCVDLENVV